MLREERCFVLFFGSAASSLLFGLFSSCGKSQGFFYIRARALGHVGSVVVWFPGSKAQAESLWCTATLVAMRHVESSQARD